MRGTIFVTWCYFSPCVPVVKRVDPTLKSYWQRSKNRTLEVYGHCRFVQCFSSRAFHCQFQPGNVWYSEKLQIINTLYIDMFCNIRVQPTRTPFYNLNSLHRFTMLPSHLYPSRLLEFLRIFKNLALFGIHLLCPPRGRNARKSAIFKHRDGICRKSICLRVKSAES